MIGKLLGNRYEIISQLGGGGMALVYKGRDTLLNRQVTVKLLRPEYTCDEEFVARFRREAQAVAKLSHPNIVSVYDVGQEGDTHYIVMEYVEGKNLKELIREQGVMPVNRAVDIARQICEGLDHAHENGIVHRDIKPHNILVTAGGKVKVTDFGIARAVTSATVTQAGTIVGSVHYFSPEQAKGENTVARSDIYSVGVVLYEMVTGQVPFQGDSPIGVALKHIQEQPPVPSSLNRNISPELEKVILRAMEKDITLRYQSAGDMARDLRTVLCGEISDETRYLNEDEFATRVLTAPRIIRKEKAEEDDEDEMAPRRRKRVRPMAKAILAVLIIGLLAGAATGINSFLNVPEVTVPDLREATLDTAISTLTGLGLESKIERQYHPQAPLDTVISQDPEPNKKVRKGFTVTLTVSKGPKYVTVPDVRKKELSIAEVELGNLGFKVETTDVYSDEVAKGSVVEQTPGADSQAVEGSTVTLEVSMGREPKYVAVPDLRGRTLEDARKMLTDLNLRLSETVNEAPSNDYIPGTIMAQQPSPGDNLQEGEAVQVTLSTGPGPEAKTATVSVELPDDNITHQVQIVVIDVTGTREVYDETHDAGEVVTQPVTYYKKGKIQVFVDGKKLKEQLVN
ncbi:MAG: Stk1 family PASTA domain-containing Ser/Thr kinase [Bacillota bacterium]